MNSFVFSFILLCIVELVHGNTGCNQSGAAPTKYWNTHTLRCEVCTVCDEGEKVVSPCQDLKDASCEKCPEGTYLDSVNKSLCVQCSYCRKGEVVESECTSSADTLCRRILVRTIPPSEGPVVTKLSTPTTRLIHHPKTSTSSQREDYASRAPECRYENRSRFSDALMWVLVVAVVLSFIGNVVLMSKLRSRNGTLTLPWTFKAKKMPTPHRTEGRTTPKATVVSASEASETMVPIENDKKFRDTTADVTEKLARLLNVNSGNNWRNLAGKMAYSCNFTANLQLTPTEATQKLLEDWQTKSDATVYKLYCYLEELGRHDAMAVLLPLLATQPVESSMV